MKDYYRAAEDFRKARNRASFEDLLARLKGQNAELLSYEEVRQKIRTSGVISQTIREVPLGDIVGSVGRYSDFTRSFLPKRSSDEDRWVKIMMATEDMGGLPPVDLYLIDEVYFVVDGHHRVSVAKKVGAETIQAHVTEIRSSIPLAPDVDRNDLIIKSEYADFLAETQINQLRSGIDLTVSEAGQYGNLLEHICVHRYFMGIDQGRDIAFAEAVTHWYDTVYLPVIQLVREMGILKDFAGRTEADLYLWMSKHRTDIVEELEWEVDYEAVLSQFVEEKGSRWWKLFSELGQRVIDVVTTDEEPELITKDELPTGVLATRTERLFNDILVPLSGLEVGWIALDVALRVAVKEQGRILGIHVQTEESQPDEFDTSNIENGFHWRCGESDISCKMVFAEGSISKNICERARWVDLVVVKLLYPPGTSALARFSSGISKMIHSCIRPILVVAGASPSLSKPMLLWEGRKRSRLAAMIAAYVAGEWETPLVVINASRDSEGGIKGFKKLRKYLKQFDIDVTYMSSVNGTPEEVLRAAEVSGCGWIISAGYRSGRIREIVFGAFLDELLAQSDLPILICP